MTARVNQSVPKSFVLKILISKFFDIYALHMVFANVIVFTRMFIGFREIAGWGATHSVQFFLSMGAPSPIFFGKINQPHPDGLSANEGTHLHRREAGRIDG
jgi:hypothetical protein